MKITQSQLRQIIKEVIKEVDPRLSALAGPTNVEPVQQRQQQAYDPSNPLAGPTQAEPQQAAAGNKPLMLVAKELEVLLAKIKKALG